MKKLLRLMAILSLTAIAAAGCVKENIPDGFDIDLQVKATSFAAEGQTPDVHTVPVGSTLGLYAFDIDGNAFHDNVLSDVAVDGMVSGVRFTSRANYDIAVYMPFREDASNPVAIGFTHGDDVLWGLSSDLSESVVPVLMSHVVSQVTFQVRDADGNPVEGSTVEVGGFFDSATLNAINGEMTPGAATAAKVTVLNTPVCVFSSREGGLHTLDATVSLDTIGELPEDFYGSEIEQSLEQGVAYLFTLTIPRDSNTPITISATVIPWVDGGHENVDVE